MIGPVRYKIQLGKTLYARGEYDRAKGHLREALSMDNQLADVHHMLGVMAHLQGDLESAVHHLEQALLIHPEYIEAAVHLIATYHDRGEHEKAERLYPQIRVSARPHDGKLDTFTQGKIANLHADIARAYEEIGWGKEAIEEYKKALQIAPSFVDLRTELGILLRRSGSLEQARIELEKAVGTASQYLPARIQLGLTLHALGQKQQAKKQWEQALQIDPTNLHAKMCMRLLDRK